MVPMMPTAVSRRWSPVDVWTRLVANPRLSLGATFVVALVLRVAYNLTIARSYVPEGDAVAYIALGRHLLSWHCYCVDGPGLPTTVRPPIFPLFLAGVFAVFGPNLLAARLALAVVGSITCVLTALIAADLFGARAGVVAGLLAAIYPQLFINDAWLYSESLAICLFAASTLAAMRIARRPTTVRWALLGGLFGITALARPNGVYVLGALLVWALVALSARQLSPREAALALAAVCAGFAAVLAPWVVRNYVVTSGAFVPLTTVSGIVIAGSYNQGVLTWPFIQGGWLNPWSIPFWSAHDHAILESFPSVCWGRCEVARDTATRAIGIHWALTHVSSLPRLLYYRMRSFWLPASPAFEGGMPTWRRYPETVVPAVYVLALAGLYTLRARWREALIPCLFGATVVAGAAVFYGSPRMRAPLEPILVALAAGGALYLVDLAAQAVRRRRAKVGVTPQPG